VLGDEVFGLEFVVSVSGQYENYRCQEKSERQKSSRFVYDGRRHDSFSPFSNGQFRNAKSNRHYPEFRCRRKKKPGVAYDNNTRLDWKVSLETSDC